MTQETKTKVTTIKVVRYIAVTFALGLGARVAIAGWIKIDDAVNNALKAKFRG